MLRGIVSGAKKDIWIFSMTLCLSRSKLYMCRYHVHHTFLRMNIKIQYKLMGHKEEIIYQHDFGMDITNNPQYTQK